MGQSAADSSALICSSDPVTFIVPGEPLGWARTRPRFRPKPGAANLYFTPYKQRQYAATIGWKAKDAMRARAWLTGPLMLRVAALFTWPVNTSKRERARPFAFWKVTKPDWDNLGKLVSDACNKIVYKDDAQVCDSRIIKGYSDKPGLYVTIEQANSNMDALAMEWRGVITEEEYRRAMGLI